LYVFLESLPSWAIQRTTIWLGYALKNSIELLIRSRERWLDWWRHVWNSRHTAWVTLVRTKAAGHREARRSLWRRCGVAGCERAGRVYRCRLRNLPSSATSLCRGTEPGRAGPTRRRADTTPGRPHWANIRGPTLLFLPCMFTLC